MRTLLALVGGASLLLAPRLAGADEIDALGGKVVELDARIGELSGQLKPPMEPGPEIAERRLIDAQVLYELKNYEAASIILFDVVEKYPQSSAYPEALFYLADSLYLNRDYLSSRRFFEKIIETGPSHKRYAESLQRLIELSLHTGDYSPVDGYIAKLEGYSQQQQLPSVPYVKGKYFYFRQQYDKALEALKLIGPTHPYYFHALYFIGAASVAKGPANLPEAIDSFGTILKTEAKTDSQKRIAELAHMALARIYYDRGQLTNALDEYSKISRKSDLFNDALYESAWVSIKGKDYKKAGRALDLLLTNAPDTPLAPEVKLLMGNLHIRQEEYGPATDRFTRTRDEFDPIYRQLNQQLTQQGDPKKYFRDLIAKNLGKFDTAMIFPPLAVKWVHSEPDTERALTLIGDVGDLKKSLDESEEIVRRLEKALTGPARVNVFPELAHARTRGVEIQNSLIAVRTKLSNREAQLIAPVAGAERDQLNRLAAERAELETKLAALPSDADTMEKRQKKAREQFNEVDRQAVEAQVALTGLLASTAATKKFYHDQVEKTLPPDQQAAAQQELEAWTTELAAAQAELDRTRRDITDAMQTVGVDDQDMQAAAQLKAQYNEILQREHAVSVQVRSRLAAQDRTKAEQIESILDRAKGVEQKIGQYNGRIDEMLDARLKEIESALGEEKAHVAAYRQSLGGYTDESEDVGGGIVAENFKSVANRFYQVVVRSDVGIVDVAWALKDSKTQSTRRLIAERQRELKLLDDEFKEVLKE